VGFGLAAAQLGLAAVFTTAAIAKLRDRAGSRTAVVDFGLPLALAGPVAALLPVAELLVALALIPTRSAAWGALGGLVLLLAFSAAIAANLALGRAPACHCFGQVHSSPAGWSSLARNAVLVGAAAAVAAGTLVWCAVGLACAAVFGLCSVIRTQRESHHPVRDGLPIGMLAPDFALPDLTGAIRTLADLSAEGKPVLLVFSDPGCGACVAMAPALADWQRRHADLLNVVVVTRGGAEQNRREAAAAGLRATHVLTDPYLAHIYAVGGTPAAVLIGTDDRIASTPAAGQAAIQALVSRQVANLESGYSTVKAVRTPDGRRGLPRLEFMLSLANSLGVMLALVDSPAMAADGIRARTRPCPPSYKRCGGRCCPPTFVCSHRAQRRPRCICPTGTHVCRGRCVNLHTSASHCGSCGHRCPPGTVCLHGSCEGGDGTGTGPGGTGTCDCPSGRACCQGRCTNLNDDTANCAGCGKACPAGTSCCEGGCVDRNSDPANCGACGKRCNPGEVCAEGTCRTSCPSGLTNCDGSCVDLQRSQAHCGRCGNGCSSASESTQCCGGRCVDLAINPDNCGACGRHCLPPCNCQGPTATLPGGRCAGAPGCPDS
jgi:peroxiredoxin